MSGRASRIVFHEAPDEVAWADSAAAAIAHSLREALLEADRAHLLLSGGSTPAPVYRALAAQALAWSRLQVGLVDERDVEPDASGSNARLVRESLLRDAAAGAHFEPLRRSHESLADALVRANARLRGVRVAACVLGMGDDGHTASLFPGALDLQAALESGEPYATIDARGCAVAGAHPHRISLTPSGIAQSRQRLLLIRGAGKRAVLQRALANGNANELPIRAVLDLAGAPLHVHWCP